MQSGPFTLLPVLAFAALIGGCAGTAGPAGSNSRYKVGSPYLARGVWYVPREDFTYDAVGLASWYGDREHGRLTANGEVFDQNELTAAHPTLQLPSLAEVTNLESGRTVRLRINDRGPFAEGRILDVSRRVAQLLGFEQQGTAMVRVRILPEESWSLARAAGRAAAPSTAAPLVGRADVPARLVVEATLPPGSDIAAWRGWSAAVGVAMEIVAASSPAGRSGVRLRVGPFGSIQAAERIIVPLLNAGLADASIRAAPITADPVALHPPL